MDDIRAFLSRKPLLFDGGMGTYYKAAPGTDCEQANPVSYTHLRAHET